MITECGGSAGNEKLLKGEVKRSCLGRVSLLLPGHTQVPGALLVYIDFGLCLCGLHRYQAGLYQFCYSSGKCSHHMSLSLHPLISSKVMVSFTLESPLRDTSTIRGTEKSGRAQEGLRRVLEMRAARLSGTQREEEME